MRAVHVWLRSTDLLRFDTCNNEKNYENHMHDDRGPQKWSDGSAANANPDEIQRDKNAVGKHSVELLTVAPPKTGTRIRAIPRRRMERWMYPSAPGSMLTICGLPSENSQLLAICRVVELCDAASRSQRFPVLRYAANRVGSQLVAPRR